MLTAKRFTSRTTASTLQRLEDAAANLRPIGLRESHRAAIRAIQSALADLNAAYLLQAQVDGMFGPRTAAAVETFQRDYGLYADGFVGRQTMTQLDVIYSGDAVRTPSGTSLHVGVNTLDSGHYGDSVASLASCVNDARATLKLAERLGYSGAVLTDEDATVANVTAAIRNAADTLFEGDAFLFSFSGHGAQIPNTSLDEEPDGMDETLCLYDRMLIDDELYTLLGQFRAGVRVFLVFDSCHSATAAKAKQLVEVGRKAIKDVSVRNLEGSLKEVDVAIATVPVTRAEIGGHADVEVLSAQPLTSDELDAALADDLNVADLQPKEPSKLSAQSKAGVDLFAELESDAALAPSKLLSPWETPYEPKGIYDQLRTVVGPKELVDLEAKIATLAACRDYQTTLAGSVLSEFTSNLMAVWGAGKFDGSSQQLMARVNELGSQNGAIRTLTTYGPAGSALEYERPFAI